jgi:hypothetical protein
MAQKVNIGLGDKVYVGTLEAKEGERGEETSFSLSGELKQVEDADIQWRRWEAAVAAMQGILSNQKLYDEIVEQWSDDEDLPCWEAVAHESLVFADTLVKEFKKEKRCYK